MKIKLIFILILMVGFASAQLGYSNSNLPKINPPVITTTTSSLGNVTSVSSGDGCIFVSPTTGAVTITFNTSCGGAGVGGTYNATYDKWAYNQTIAQNPFDQDLNKSSNSSFNSISLNQQYNPYISSEVNGKLLDLGTNYNQSGYRNYSAYGGFIRIDTRGGYRNDTLFSIIFNNINNPGGGGAGNEEKIFQVSTKGEVNSSYFIGDGSRLTNISGTGGGGNPFDQSLNTTDTASFQKIGVNITNPTEEIQINAGNSPFLMVNDTHFGTHVKVGVLDLGGSSYAGIWFNQEIPLISTFSFLASGTSTIFNSPGGTMYFRVSNSNKLYVTSAYMQFLAGGSLLPPLSNAVATFQKTSGTTSNSFVSIISGTIGNAAVYFGDTDSKTSGAIDYNNNGDFMTLRANDIDQVVINSTSVQLNNNLNAHDIYIDTLNYNSPSLTCSKENDGTTYCQIVVMKYPEYPVLFHFNTTTFEVLNITFNGQSFTKNSFWNGPCQTNQNTIDMCLKINDKITKLQDKKECTNNGNEYNNETCYTTTLEQVTYNEAIEIEYVNETWTQPAVCTRLNQTNLMTYQEECEQIITTPNLKPYYHFKDNCDWEENRGYICLTKIEVVG